VEHHVIVLSCDADVSEDHPSSSREGKAFCSAIYLSVSNNTTAVVEAVSQPVIMWSTIRPKKVYPFPFRNKQTLYVARLRERF